MVSNEGRTVTRRALLGTAGSTAGIAGCNRNVERPGRTVAEPTNQTATTASGAGLAYTIRPDGEGYVAVADATGAVAFSGAAPMAVAQRAVDAIVQQRDLDPDATDPFPGGSAALTAARGALGGRIGFAPGTYRVTQPLRLTDSFLTVDGAGAVFRPDEEFTGYVVRVERTSDTRVTGFPSGLEAVSVQNVTIVGDDRCKGLYFQRADRNFVANVFAASLDGPGLYLSTGTRECSFHNVYLRMCGAQDGSTPAVRIGPDPENRGPLGENPPHPNTIDFWGLITDYCWNQHVVLESRRFAHGQTKDVRFWGGQHHAWQKDFDRDLQITDPMVDLRGARGVKFWGTHFAMTAPGEAQVNFQRSPEGIKNNGPFSFHGCNFASPPTLAPDSVGIRVRGTANPGGKRSPGITLVGNNFGAYGPIQHAVDWGGGDYDVNRVANTYRTREKRDGAWTPTDPFVGKPPRDAFARRVQEVVE
jgi:hypothetical protein